MDNRQWECSNGLLCRRFWQKPFLSQLVTFELFQFRLQTRKCQHPLKKIEDKDQRYAKHA